MYKLQGPGFSPDMSALKQHRFRGYVSGLKPGPTCVFSLPRNPDSTLLPNLARVPGYMSAGKRLAYLCFMNAFRGIKELWLRLVRMPSEEARDATQRKFGNAVLYREQTKEVWRYAAADWITPRNSKAPFGRKGAIIATAFPVWLPWPELFFFCSIRALSALN